MKTLLSNILFAFLFAILPFANGYSQADTAKLNDIRKLEFKRSAWHKNYFCF